MFGHRRTDSFGKGRSPFRSCAETGVTFLKSVASKENNTVKKLGQMANGSSSIKPSTLCKKICFSFLHPRRLLRIKSSCRFLLLATLTLSTLILLFTITEMDRRSPVIHDFVEDTQNKFDHLKKDLEADTLLVGKSSEDKRLRVDKKHLIQLGLPANPDDINNEVGCMQIVFTINQI